MIKNRWSFWDPITINGVGAVKYCDLIDASPYVPFTVYDVTKPLQIISLPQASARRKYMADQLIQTNYEFFPALLGSDYVDVMRPNIQFKIRGDRGRMKAGELGVYMSHMELYCSLLVSDTFDSICIMEDDATILSLTTPEFPADWDICFLGTNPLYCHVDRTNESKWSRLKSDQCIPCPFAYYVSKKGARRLLKYALPVEAPIDEYIRQQMGSMAIYALQDSIVSQSSHFPTTIHGTRMIDQND